MEFGIFGRITTQKKTTDSCFGVFICLDCNRMLERLSFNLAHSYYPDPYIGPELCQIQSMSIHRNTDSQCAIGKESEAQA